MVVFVKHTIILYDASNKFGVIPFKTDYQATLKVSIVHAAFQYTCQYTETFYVLM